LPERVAAGFALPGRAARAAPLAFKALLFKPAPRLPEGCMLKKRLFKDYPVTISELRRQGSTHRRAVVSYQTRTPSSSRPACTERTFVQRCAHQIQEPSRMIIPAFRLLPGFGLRALANDLLIAAVLLPGLSHAQAGAPRALPAIGARLSCASLSTADLKGVVDQPVHIRAATSPAGTRISRCA
jgi:hypothetical protein